MRLGCGLLVASFLFGCLDDMKWLLGAMVVYLSLAMTTNADAMVMVHG